MFLRTSQTLPLVIAFAVFLSLPPGLGGPAPASAQSVCVPDQTDLTTGGNRLSNTAEPLGSADAQYRLASAPIGVTSTQAYSIPTLANPGPWVVPPSYARWVNPWEPTTPYSNNGQPGGTTSGPGSASLNGATPYSYYVEFTLSNTPYTNFEIDIDFAADDFVNVLLNGQDIGQAGIFTTSNGFAVWHSLQYSGDTLNMGHFQVGTNRLTFNVINWIIYTGLVVDGLFTQSCDQACSFLIPQTWDLSTGITKSPSPNTPSIPIVYGAPDNRWYMEEVAGTATPSHPNPNSLPPQTSPTVWAVPTTAAKWLSTGGGIFNPGPSTLAGQYQYTIEFIVPCVPSICQDLHLDLDFAAAQDVEFFLNGNSLGAPTTAAWSALHPLSVTGCSTWFVAGTNTLSAVVQNPNPDATGLLVQGGYTIDP